MNLQSFIIGLFGGGLCTICGAFWGWHQGWKHAQPYYQDTEEDS